MALREESSQDLLQAYVDLKHQSLGYTKSLALAVALDLRIPDAIHRHGGSATLAQILAETGLHPNKLHALCRLMRLLTVSGTFSVQQPSAGGGDDGSTAVDSSDGADVVYRLTTASRFLVSDEVSSESMVPFVSLKLYSLAVSPQARGICAWFRQEQNDPPAYALALRQTSLTFWGSSDDVNTVLHKAMLADCRFLMPIVLRECGEQVFRGIDSLVDVGGGHGGASTAIATAFPHLKCSVLDLEHVVAGAPSGGNVQFVAGNMFESIPPATAIFLKYILHDWDDDECVKILKNCKQAVSPRDAGGKVIILDMVVGYGQPDIKLLETQVMFDLHIMSMNGAERTEQEFKKIFAEAGFKDYKILTLVGTLSVIEVYP